MGKTKIPDLYDFKAPSWLFWLYRINRSIGLAAERRWLANTKERGTALGPSGYWEAGSNGKS